MIPKIIHTIWFGGNFPERCKQLLDTWVKYNKDFEFKYWDENNIPDGILYSTKIILKDYAYASVVKSNQLRLEVIRLFGGIYKDTDMECLRSFDDLLNTSSFCGAKLNIFPNSIFGAEKGNSIISEACKFSGEYIISKREDYVKRDINSYKIVPIITRQTIDQYFCNMETIYPRTYFHVNHKEEIVPPRYVRHFFFGVRENGWNYEMGRKEWKSELINTDNFKCTMCGSCCKWYEIISITKNDKDRWEKEKRKDILDSLIIHKHSKELIFDCKDSICPWLKDNKCLIQDTKPEVCKKFPSFQTQADAIKCKGFC